MDITNNQMIAERLREAFDQLEVGSEVRLVVAERESAQGPQASTVDPIGKHHLVEPLP